MIKLISYLLSNVEWGKGFGHSLSRHLLGDIKNTDKIVFIPTSFDDQIKTKRYLESYCSAFNRLGLKFKDVVVLSYEMDSIELIQEIHSADVLFLMGGDTLSQFSFMNENELIEPLRKFRGVMMGISAGAINMCSISLLTFEHPTENLHIYSGVGIVNLTVEVHFNIKSKKQLSILKEASTYIDEIYCITDYSCIRVSEDDVKIIGSEIYIYKDDKIVVI